MSKRRQIGDVVLLDDEDGTPKYLARIDALGADHRDRCPHSMLDADHDQDCAEWPNMQVLDQNHLPTGDWVHHVPECQMADPE